MLEGNSTGYLFEQDANGDNHNRKDVREIFEPVVSQILELISKQVIEVLKSGKGPVAVNPPYLLLNTPLRPVFVS